MLAPVRNRAISPVLGVALMVVLTVLLASTLGYMFQVAPDERTAEDIVNDDRPDGTDESDGLQSELVIAEDDAPGADDVVHSTVVEVDGAAGTTLGSITVDYPKAETDHSIAKHEAVLTVGVDADADGNLERTFDEDDVSGVGLNDDDSRVTITFDTGYTLADGDRVKVRFEGANNPDDDGDYAVSVTLNGAQTTDGTLTIE